DFFAALDPGLLTGDAHTFVNCRGIVGADFRADAVLQRSDNFSARRVIFRVRGEDQEHIQRQAQRIALNLDVAFLHDVEEAHLDFSGKVGQFVDGKDSAVGARQQSIVNGELIGKVAASTSGADGVNVAENVRDGHVGRGQFFHVTLVTRQPGNGSVFALRSHLFAAGAANGPQRVIVNFAAGNHGDFRVEQLNQAAK